MCGDEGRSLLLPLLSEETRHREKGILAAHCLSDEWEVLSVAS